MVQEVREGSKRLQCSLFEDLFSSFILFSWFREKKNGKMIVNNYIRILLFLDYQLCIIPIRI